MPPTYDAAMEIASYKKKQSKSKSYAAIVRLGKSYTGSNAQAVKCATHNLEVYLERWIKYLRQSYGRYREATGDEYRMNDTKSLKSKMEDRYNTLRAALGLPGDVLDEKEDGCYEAKDGQNYIISS